MEFIKDKWYKGEKNNYYIKFSHMEIKNGYNKIYYNESYYTNRGWESKQDYWAHTQLEKFALNNPVTIEELRKILPKDHPDLNKEINYEIY
jgi:hypothetical protein